MVKLNKRLHILFLCTGNSCRSQMAEGWARHLKPSEIEAYSAGTEKRGLDPLAVRVMAEAGVDISGQRSKTIDELPEQNFDWVITLCGHAKESCPFFPGGTRKMHKGFDDPPALVKEASNGEKALGNYRRVRDEIREFIDQLPEALCS